MNKQETEDKIRKIILSCVQIEGLTAEQLKAEEPLFGDGIGLDSIDALEIGAQLRKTFKVKFKTNAEENKAHFRSISTLADFIIANAPAEQNN